jgi:hypothetical protein
MEFLDTHFPLAKEHPSPLVEDLYTPAAISLPALVIASTISYLGSFVKHHQ